MTLRLTLLTLALSSLAASGQEPPLPRFRSGANLVAVDAYVSKDGVPVTDLRAEDLEVLEDDRAQKIESFRLVQARAAGGITTRPEPMGSAAQRDAASDPESRLFVLYLDQWHVSLGGSAKARAPVSEILNRVISPDDLVGVMTPEMPPQGLNLTRRASAIDRMLQDNWTWGERDKGITSDPRERDLVLCYPDGPGKTELSGVAKELIERRRELKTLQSLDALVSHLGTLRDERKFVVLLTEGWVLFRRNDRLGGVLAPVGPGSIPGAIPVGVGTDGRIVTGQGPRESGGGPESCDRERVLLSFVDHEYELRQLAQRANRANVSFYIIDPRGLAAFDDTIGPMRPATPDQDRARMSARQNGVRELAEQTDGAVALNTNDVRGATARMMADLGSYYLMNYYSTNTKLDGRFRRITVRVKRDGVEVRARPGYLAPTEAEARAAGVAVAGAPGGPAALPPVVTRALEMITPARGNLPVRIQAAGARGSIRAVVELDPVTLKLPEWATGATVRVTIDPEKGSGPESQIVTSVVDPGMRSVVVAAAGNPFPPGRYIIRAEVTPKSGRIPIQASTAAIVPPEAAEVGTGLLALRRGPSTGLAYIATADPRFRRTERLRVEVPLAAAGHAGSARLLTRTGQPMPLVATYSTRVDAAANVTFGVADIVLAPLAEGDYVLELTLVKGRSSEVVAYGFRIVP